MANNPTKTQTPAPTKKHLARMQREQMWRRWLIIGTIVVVVLVVGVLLYGVVFQPLIQSRQAVAMVEDQKITSGSWQTRVRFQRANLLNNALQTYQFAQAFTDPSFQSSFASQLQQIKYQLDPTSVGQQVLSTMIDEIIIAKEAAKKGITVSNAEVDKLFSDSFGYFPNGTPTSKPTDTPIATSTLSSLQLTLIPPTATQQPTETASATEEATPTEALATPTAAANPTATTQPTPTANSVEGSGVYKQTVDQFDTNFGINENQFRATLRQILLAQLYREKVQEAVLAESSVSHTEPQVWARHILVEDQTTAQQIYDRLQSGEDFCKIAAEFSTDESNKASCGDLGWFGKGKMVTEFENAAFALKVGEISQPVQTQFGYHVIQSLGNEERPLTESEFSTLQSTKFQEWLAARKEEYKIETFDDIWQARVPQEPAWPTVFDQFIAQAQQPTPAPVEVTPAP